MPIHDQGYRRYRGERAPHGRAWAVIAFSGIRTLLRRRAFLGLLFVCWFPFFVRALQIYAAANVPQAEFLRPTPEMFRQFLGQQDLFVFLVAVYAGAGLIANDLRANALQIYLSKPLTRAEYVFGKLAILMAFILLVTWVPAIALLAVESMFAGNFTFFRANIHLLPAITVFSLIQALTVASTMLALSSLSRSSRYAAVLYAVIIFFSQAIANVVVTVTGDSRWSSISIGNNLSQVADAVFRLPLGSQIPVPLAILVIVAFVTISGLILERRVRGVEVVA